MNERELIIERLNELEVRVIKNIAKALQIDGYQAFTTDDLVEEVADEILNENSKAYPKTRKEIKRILIKYGKRIKESDGNFEKELVELKEKFKKEQRIILKAYEIELNEFFTDPVNFTTF